MRHLRLTAGAVLLAVALAASLPAQRVEAKPCGNGFIRDDYVCHKGTSGGGGGGGDDATTVGIVVVGVSLLLVGGVIALLVYADPKRTQGSGWGLPPSSTPLGPVISFEAAPVWTTVRVLLGEPLRF